MAAIRLRNLYAVAMLSGIYSLLTAGLFVVMDAVDVAFTEAAVGAGVATVFMLGALALTSSREKPPSGRVALGHVWVALLVVLTVGAALLYAMLDMPPFGAPDNPAHVHVAPRYIEQSPVEIDIPNMVTSVLASYRGFDTLGETVVVFTAAVGVVLLLGVGARQDGEDGEDGEDGKDGKDGKDGEDGEDRGNGDGSEGASR